MKRGTLDRTTDRLTVVRRHLEAGMSTTASADALGVTPRTVTRLRARIRGYNLPHIPQPTPEQLAEYEQRLNDGWSYKEIARTYHCCENMLSRRFPGRGWDRSEVGRAGAAGRVMNNLPDFVEPASKTTFATLNPVNPAGARNFHRDNPLMCTPSDPATRTRRRNAA